MSDDATQIASSSSEAVDRVKAAFPFDDYITGDLAPWLTVGTAVQNYLKPGDRLFDLGSGPCDKTAVAQALGCQCTAVDDLQDDWHLRGDNTERIKGFAREMGISFSQEFTPLKPQSYDMVMMNDVLEHIHDSPRDLLISLTEGLKTGGYLFATVPNLANIRKRLDILRGRTNLPNYDLYYWYQGRWRGPQREYVEGDLRAMCANLGLEILELKTVHHMLQKLPAKVRPIYKAATVLFPGWRDTWYLIARKPAGWTPQHTVSDQKFAEIYGQSAKESLYTVDR